MEKSSPKEENMSQGIPQDIIGYRIIKANAAGSLEIFVNEELKNGWSLYGYPFMSAQFVCQTMVKYGQAPYPTGS